MRQERGSNGSIRSSALWGKPSKGESLSSALWGKGGRGIVATLAIHVADALDSMLTNRIYKAARPVGEALDELRRGAGSQFCPRTVAALERLLEGDETRELPMSPPVAAAS
jgi:hypothetical protein